MLTMCMRESWRGGLEGGERKQGPHVQAAMRRSGKSSGVGTVAAVAALAATLFRPQINIHNLLKLLYK